MATRLVWRRRGNAGQAAEETAAGMMRRGGCANLRGALPRGLRRAGFLGLARHPVRVRGACCSSWRRSFCPLPPVPGLPWTSRRFPGHLSTTEQRKHTQGASGGPAPEHPGTLDPSLPEPKPAPVSARTPQLVLSLQIFSNTAGVFREILSLDLAGDSRYSQKFR